MHAAGRRAARQASACVRLAWWTRRPRPTCWRVPHHRAARLRPEGRAVRAPPPANLRRAVPGLAALSISWVAAQTEDTKRYEEVIQRIGGRAGVAYAHDR